MAIGSSLSGINFAGIGSGIDTESIVRRLIQLEARPLSRLEQQRTQLQARQSIYQAFKGRLQSIQSAASALNSPTAFNPVTAASTKAEVATVSAGEGAAAGSYNLSVTRLATTHKLSSAAQTDATTALNLSGTMSVNGRGVTIGAADNLTTIAQKINGADAGVTASIINGGTGSAYLTLTAKNTGVDGKVQISDVSGTLASTLGLANGAAAIRAPITNGFKSASFASSTTAVGTLLGASGLSAGTIELNGTSINVNLATMSLADIAGAINSSAAGVTASVKSVTENGATRQQLEITGAGSTPTWADPNGILQTLGITQRGFGNQLIAAQDASYSLDGMAFTSATNSITTVIPGATITLLKANETTPETTTLNLAQDNTKVKDKVKEFMNAFNAMVDFVKQNSQFDKESFQSGPLFGDGTVQSVEGTLAQSMLNTVTGLQSQYSNLTQMGFSFDTDGKLELNEATLDAALNTSPSAVGNLFRSTGRASVDTLSFVSTGNRTRPSGPVGYSVNITQAATKHAQFATIGGGGTLGIADKLTFSGTLFGTNTYDLNFGPGATIDSMVSTINNDARLKDSVIATNDGGRLKVEAKRFGTAGAFNMAVTASGGENPTDPRIFLDGTTTGRDVAGTINGEAATGAGQFLIGSANNANTDGLQIQYTGTTTGNIGNVIVSIGVAANVNALVSTFTDTVNGLMTGADQALQSQIDTIGESIAAIEKRLTVREQDLRRRFTAMEEAIARAQQQGARLQAIR